MAKDSLNIYKFGSICTFLALGFIFADVIIGNITGGNLSALPQTAIGRFTQFQQSTLLGLYNLDLLNAMVQILIIPSIFSLYLAQRKVNMPFALLAFILFLLGSVLLVAGNAALPMMELSRKYFATAEETQKILYAAAGESLLAKGAHGSPGVFLGFFIPNLANFIMAIIMLHGKVFSKTNAWLGIAGSILMMVYIILVNFHTGIEQMATVFAMPGGLLLMAWMIIYGIKLLKLKEI